jgi:hypothetical protein
MLASITPLGERGRQARWGVTMSAFLTGSTAAGAAAGAVIGGAGRIALPATLSAQARLALLAAVALLAAALDARPGLPPGPRRQVNERWLDEYRGWVYGLGFGAQLGLGITTVISSAATYVAFAAAFLTADAGRGALVVGCFGALRGLTPLAAAHVRAPEQLVALHVRLGRLRRPGERAVLTVLLAIVGGAAIGSLA